MLMNSSGPQQIDVTYDGNPIPQSPLSVTAMPGCDASKVKAYGPGQYFFYICSIIILYNTFVVKNNFASEQHSTRLLNLLYFTSETTRTLFIRKLQIKNDILYFIILNGLFFAYLMLSLGYGLLNIWVWGMMAKICIKVYWTTP